MGGATVRAYEQPNGGAVTLEIFVGDKRRGCITLPSRYGGDDYIDGPTGRRIRSLPQAMVFVKHLRDAAIEAKRGGYEPKKHDPCGS